jgi:hypothetical protein
MFLVDKRKGSTVIMLAFCFFNFAFGNPLDQENNIPELRPGPHFFIDDYLIAYQSFLNRTVNNPERYPTPVVTGGENGDQNFQPYMSVLRDDKTGKFRMWYNTPENKSQSHIGYIESDDGIHWNRPHRVLQDPDTIKFGVTVLDRGINFPELDKRYVLAYYFKDGLRIATSPDGLHWTSLTDTSLIKHNHDINSLHWDPLRKQYYLIFSVWNPNKDWNDNQRNPWESVSTDLIHWEKPWQIISAKMGAPIEKGETQFYAMSGVINRGDLLIGLVKVLRDDINATPGKTGKEMGDLDRKAAGLGYTVLAWSRDGKTWMRDYQPFIPHNPVPGTWDHAMAWGDEQVVVGDKTYIYYAGYARGHKVNRFDERQIGLARMPRDRYVAREADINPGSLTTRPILLKGSKISLNARVPGELRVRLLDEKGDPLKGFEWSNIQGDSVAHPINWTGHLSDLAGKPVRLDFELRNAQLYGFDLYK